MKKIPTLFTRQFENGKIVGISPEITPGCEEAFLHGKATVKYDGSCCAIINGELFKRYDAKHGKLAPDGAIPCCDPDPITGHWPHWVRVNMNNPADRWFCEALTHTWLDWFMGTGSPLPDGTYEAMGPHFNGNPDGLSRDYLVMHGCKVLPNIPRSFEGVREWLAEHYVEGLVFWYNGEPVCKIKRTDFGFPWKENKRR